MKILFFFNFCKNTMYQYPRPQFSYISYRYYLNRKRETYFIQIGSDTFELLDGVVGLAFSARLGTVYYQPLATDRLFSVPTTALQAGPPAFGEQLPVTLVGKKSSQGLALAVDPRDDTILFSPLTETAIAAWQPQTNQQRYMLLSFYEDNLVLYLNEDELTIVRMTIHICSS